MQRSIVAVIPLYQGAKFIETSLRSVLAQTLPPDEIVVVDDGSRDNGAEIAAKIASGDPRIKVLRKDNGGQSSARNLGVAKSTSELIAFLDQDDWWYPNHLEKLAASLPADISTFGWVYSDLDEYDASGKLVERRMIANMKLGIEHPKRTLLNCLGQNMYVLPSASLISRAAFEAVGGFDERLSGYEDDDLFLRIFRDGWSNTFIRQSLSAWRIHSGSSSYSARMLLSGMIYAQKLMEAFPDDLSRHRHFWRDLIALRFLTVALANYAKSATATDPEAFSTALRYIDMIGPYVRRRSKRGLMLMAARPFMGSRTLARLASLFYPVARRLLAR